MNRKAWTTIMIMSIMFTSVYADESTQQGAEDFDWLTCTSTKKNDCTDACASSEDINCQGNCDSMARDKCISEGLSPPE